MRLKRLISSILYTAVWSIGLLYASFPGFFSKKGLDWSFQTVISGDIDSSCIPVSVMPDYIFPYIMAMLLFLVDVIYSCVLDKLNGKESRIIAVLAGYAGFTLCFLLSLSRGKGVFFILGWSCLTIVKLLKTIPKESLRVRVSRIDE